MEDDRTPINELLKQLHTLGNSSDISIDMSAQGEYLKLESEIITQIDDHIGHHLHSLNQLKDLKGKIMKGVYNIDNE